MRSLLAILVLSGCSAAPAAKPMLSPGPDDEINGPVKETVGAQLTSLVDLYKWFHQNAELSLKEEKTSEKFSAELRAAGWTVTDHVAGQARAGGRKTGEGRPALARIARTALPCKARTRPPYPRPRHPINSCRH